MKEKLYIKDGSFYRGKEKVPPVFGDAEQIKILQEEERFMDGLRNDGIDLGDDWMEYEDNVPPDQFRCLCGEFVETELKEIETCYSCGKEYKIELSEYSYQLVAKIQE